ncbi:MAG: tRNA (adenosine(37)-N6)-threonylcarbamoyltransferase complex transferase subunit TsaD [Rickettsiales bacterium]|jgi:N6-L-threonylcarbamoyladenine synthase|nr:tRNA (adenosine(37)-N6)-threonylcarbamoyltransferase complex transferase subunit TsaD [Rickettsiales bacterium]
MLILGIETSCDETAAAIVADDRRILSNIVLSQTKEHLAYGGVVPEIAARAHMDYLDQVITRALSEAKVSFADVDAIAATGGPGLIGGVIVGVMTAKAIASSYRKPFIAVNHLEGHALTVRLTQDTPFPYLLLLVSGGHCQFLMVEGVGRYQRLGGTMDDALGEAFDKTAKLLGLGYPGGPAVEALAKLGNPFAYAFSQPLKGRPGCDFSFSGLKTAVRTVVKELQALNQLNQKTIQDICASFQQTVANTVCERSLNAIKMAKISQPAIQSMVLAGGVAANQFIRGALEGICAEHDLLLSAPPIALCTDNAAMIAWAGMERFRLGMTDDLSFEPRARWPLAA